MTTPAERAVLEAAKTYVHAWDAPRTCDTESRLLREAVHTLDAEPPQPDLDALNAAVAEAVEAYLVAHPSARDPKGQPDEWIVSLSTLLARRAALLPKPRYEALGNAWTIFDNHEQKYLLPPKVAALLNKEKP